MTPVSFHGLVAYSGQKSAVELLRSIRVAGSHVEICTADRPIGPIGVVVQGCMTGMFEWDCWSKLNAEGNRVASRGLQMPTPADHDEYVAQAVWSLDRHGLDADDSDDGRHYSETWMKAHLVREIWVKSWASQAYKNAAEKIGQITNTPVRAIESGMRIWELFPASETQPYEDFENDYS